MRVAQRLGNDASLRRIPAVVCGARAVNASRGTAGPVWMRDSAGRVQTA